MKISIKSMLGETLITEDLKPKEFKTGSTGYYGNFKVSMEGRRYQVQVQAVEIGSKKSAA